MMRDRRVERGRHLARLPVRDADHGGDLVDHERPAAPREIRDELLTMIAGEPKIATYLDVPLQHVDTDVLKKMRRGYTEKVVRGMVERLRAQSPYIWLRTTMLVGHPGETEAAFQRLYEFVERWHSLSYG